METGTAKLTFAEVGPVDATEIANFLLLVRGAYAVGEIIDSPHLDLRGIVEDAVEREVRRRFGELELEALQQLFSDPLQEPLIAKSITFKSPLEIILCGSVIPISAAVVLSGGTIRFGSRSIFELEARLPPIGEGIQKLRDALSPRTHATLGYGVISRKVKLSREERDELFKYDPKTENHGGFQRFLISMQFRVNRRTGELELSVPEMNRIIRHGRRAQRGGFQGSIKKIFGRHFDLTADEGD